MTELFVTDGARTVKQDGVTGVSSGLGDDLKSAAHKRRCVTSGGADTGMVMSRAGTVLILRAGARHRGLRLIRRRPTPFPTPGGVKPPRGSPAPPPPPAFAAPAAPTPSSERRCRCAGALPEWRQRPVRIRLQRLRLVRLQPARHRDAANGERAIPPGARRRPEHARGGRPRVLRNGNAGRLARRDWSSAAMSSSTPRARAETVARASVCRRATGRRGIAGARRVIRLGGLSLPFARRRVRDPVN